MMRCIGQVMVATVLLCATTSAEEPAKTDPAYQQAINALKNRLGPGFTVKRVGMFVVGTDLDQTRAAPLETLIGQLEKGLYRDFISRRPETIIRVVLVQSDDSLRAVAKKVLEKSPLPGPGGFYFEYEHAVLADVSMGAWVLKHELTHALLHVDFGANRRAPWFNEGMASLMEPASFDDDGIHFHLDWRVVMVYNTMKTGKLPHLVDTLKLDFRSYHASQPRRWISDAMGASLLFYLHEKGLLAQFYKLYRGKFSNDPTGVKFIEQVTGKKIDQVESDWLAWVNEQGKTISLKLQPAKESEVP